MKAFGLVYGLAAYVVFLAAFLYAIAFVSNREVAMSGALLVPFTIDGKAGAAAPFACWSSRRRTRLTLRRSSTTLGRRTPRLDTCAHAKVLSDSLL